jgi:hypothetical protein
MRHKTYSSPQAIVCAVEELDVITTSGYVDAMEGMDDNMEAWEEIF